MPDFAYTARNMSGERVTGGTLLVVDNVLFGLARGRAQAHRAEGSSARREHHRNDGLDDAARAIARVRGLRTLPLLARPVTPGRSNQWLLHLAVAGVPAFAPSPELLA